MKKTCCALIINLIVLISTPSLAETFSVMLYQGANPPYTIIKNGQHSGIFVDLFTKLSQQTKHQFIFKDYPAARALQEFDMGRVDIEPGVNEQWRQHVLIKGIYTITYGYSKEIIIFKKKNAISVKTAKDLYGKTIGIVRGYSYPRFDQAFNNKLITRSENRSEKLLLKQLQAERINYVFIGERTIKYYIKQNPQYQNIELGDIVSQVQVKLRVHPNKAYIINDLNKALTTLMENGEIAAIYDKYQ
jgi:ABC-type amino acid transport substrate-binding protein